MELNGVTYEKWDWVIVPAGTVYSVQTRPGYTALAKYYAKCIRPVPDSVEFEKTQQLVKPIRR